MTKVSVVVPVYNTEKLLPRCVESLLNQTLPDLEIILVNDASPDRSLDRMREYEAAYPGRITVVDSEINRRQGGARNLGIRCARGEYIAFVDSDDAVEPDAYECAYAMAKQHDLDIVSFDYVYVTAADEKIAKRSITVRPDPGSPLTEEARRQLILYPGSVWSKLCRASFLRENDLYFPEHMFYEDNACLSFFPVYCKKWGHIDRPFYQYIENSGGTTHSPNPDHFFQRCTAALYLIDHAKERGVYERYREEFDYQFINYYFLSVSIRAVINFDRIYRDKVVELRNYVKEHYPRYNANRYYNASLNSRFTRLRNWLARIIYVSPALGILACLPLRLVRKRIPRI